ncbi:MAG: hypothetical protein A2W00_03725 [Candidatus Eisenbacteria bacterium RBG_16_71_46]|nr:MAG: hypothetical protein A2W00_03725 [Candidatus Eisenbacteria bacterium RBG_16_71_46]
MKPARLALVLPLILALHGIAAAEEARFTILHTTDLHGALTDYDYLADRSADRGLTRIATLVARVRAEGPPVLLLDDGDCIQGGPLVSVYQRDPGGLPEPMMAAMSRMGYDAMAVGNHEFGFGLETMAAARGAARFPWLAANVVRASDGSPAFAPSLVKTLDGVRVGVVGLCTPAVPAFEDSAHYAGLRFVSPVEAARDEVARLRGAERCDVVVLLAHTGLERDPLSGVARPGDTPDENWGYRLAREVPGVDVVILGHTHVVVPAIETSGALVTQAGARGEQLGRVDLTLARGGAGAPWTLRTRSARVMAIPDSVPADSALAALARPYHERTQAALGRVIGVATRDIGAPRGRFAPGPLWALIHRVQLEAGEADVSLAALPDADAAIRRGPVTLRDVARIYPFDNTLGVVEMTGAGLKRTLEQSALYLAAYTFERDRPLAEPDLPAYNFDSAEGVGYEIDLTRPAGDRISHLTFRGRALDPAQRLRVAVNSYRLNGGGGFDAVARAPRLSHTTREVRDLLVEHVRRTGKLDGAFDPGWRILPDYAASPERPLIDLLVRQGVAPIGEVLRLEPEAPALRGDLAYWLGRAFGWRAKRLSGAFADVPDSLEPWVDGALQHGILGRAASNEFLIPFGPVTAREALDWCENAARVSGYAIPPGPDDAAFRRGLLTGVSDNADSLAPAVLGYPGGRLTRAQLLGLVANTRFPTLRVLETTDFHGAILSRATDRDSRRSIGGSAVLAAWIERLRAENPEGTVLLDGGDCFQGTMISNLQFGRPVVEQMNALRYAAAAVGNHEFDWGVDTLVERAHEMRFAALGANMIERRGGRIPRWARADTLVVRRGVRVGVLGLCYRRTPTVTLAANVAHLRFEDDSATVARAVPRLRRRDKAEVVLVVGHTPAESDSLRRAVSGDLARLAQGVRGVDAWFGGHSHNRVEDEIGGAPVMIAGSHGQVVAVCDLVVDPVRDRVVEHGARLQLTFADAVTPDSAMAARVERWSQTVAPLAAVVIGRNARRLGRGGPESAVGDFVADAMREGVHADVAMQNTGGLRADLREGPITRGDIYEVMPFDNTIYTLELSGREVEQALEDGLATNRVTQVSGLRYGFDPDAPAGERVTSLTLADGSPLPLERVYRVATNNFMATGGDSYATLGGGRNRLDTGMLVREAMEAYVTARCRGGAALEVSLDGRIRRERAAVPVGGE